MLDIAHSPPTHTMSVNWTPYLLSASPPTSSFEFFSLASSALSPLPPLHPPPRSTLSADQCADCRGSRRTLKPIIIKVDSDVDGETSPSNSSDTDSAPSSPCSLGRRGKRVTFADSFGKALTEVRVMTEPSDQPPTLNPDLLASLSQRLLCVSDRPALKLTFNQPASDYMAFRDKVERRNVSLENVLLNGSIVQGTVKVKNLAFEKSVLVRITHTNWQSHTDVHATYLPRPGDMPGHPSCHDTFTFQFDVPEDCAVGQPVQFAVCYSTNTGQFWDNNDGNNYTVVWDTAQQLPPVNAATNSTHSKTMDHFVFGPSSLTDFASWHHVDTSTPYY